jgi:serine/threonine protein kinase
MRHPTHGPSPVMMQKISVQGRNGPIDLIVQVVDRQDDREVIDVAPVVLHAARDSQTPRISGTQTPAALDYVRTQSVTSGMSLGKYLLGKKLGEGTFGVVFAARDTQLDRDAAVKLLLPQNVTNVEIRRRFIEEGRATARVRHPAIVTVYDCGIEEGCAYLAMELLAGESLTSRLARSGRLAPETAMEIVRQLASALAAAHAAGVVHRDLKPDNIFLVPDPCVPSGERVKVLDFGLAKLARNDGHTAAKLVFGTPRYMSPEQTRSAAIVDARSDIYALGCVMFELVTGVPPFDGEVIDVVRAHQQRKPQRARSIIRDLPQQLDQLLDLMLQKRPDDRPQTMAAVERALLAGGARQPGAAETMAPTSQTLLRGMSPFKATLPQPSIQDGKGVAVKSAVTSAVKSAVSNPVEWPRLERSPRGTPPPLALPAPSGSLPGMPVALFPQADQSASRLRQHDVLNETLVHPIFGLPRIADTTPDTRVAPDAAVRLDGAFDEAKLACRRRPAAGPLAILAVLAVVLATFVVWRGYFADAQAEAPTLKVDSRG